MPQYMLIALASSEPPAEMEFTPEMIQAVIEKYNAWTEKLMQSGNLVTLNKLRDGGGRVVRGFGEKQVVTDGPYAETKEVIGGYWIINAASYEEAVQLASDSPQLEFGGTIEIREVEDIASLGA